MLGGIIKSACIVKRVYNKKYIIYLDDLFKNGYLTITAKKEETEEDSDKNYIRKERSYGEYSRSFYVGDVDASLINAKFNNGTLCITVPKEEKQDNKTVIEIND